MEQKPTIAEPTRQERASIAVENLLASLEHALIVEWVQTNFGGHLNFKIPNRESLADRLNELLLLHREMIVQDVHEVFTNAVAAAVQEQEDDDVKG